MSRGFLAAAALALVAGLGTWWFLSTFDREHVRVLTPPSGEARRNPFLAFQRLSERMGVKSRELRTPALVNELPRSALLVLPARREALGERDRAAIVRWIERGGHLVVEAEPASMPDPMLDALGVTRTSAPAFVPPLQGAQAQPKYAWPGDDKPFDVALYPGTLVSHPRATLTLSWRERPALVEFRQGKGRVTALSSIAFLRNHVIGKADNAEFAWRLVWTEPLPSEVLVFNRPEGLSLLRWLIANAWAVLIGAALLIVLWLARIVPRFGPLAPDPQPARRRLLDHLRAAGRFQWKAGGGGRLVEAAREAALRRLGRIHPEFAGLGPRERERYLVDLLGASPDDARRLIAGEGVRNEADLVRAIARCQRLHERLSTARRPAP